LKSRKGARFIGWTERHATAYALTYAIPKRGSQPLRRKLQAEDGHNEHDFEKTPRNIKVTPVSLTPDPLPLVGERNFWKSPCDLHASAVSRKWRDGRKPMDFFARSLSDLSDRSEPGGRARTVLHDFEAHSGPMQREIEQNELASFGASQKWTALPTGAVD